LAREVRQRSILRLLDNASEIFAAAVLRDTSDVNRSSTDQSLLMSTATFE
jgi:hypothetical protein